MNWLRVSVARKLLPLRMVYVSAAYESGAVRKMLPVNFSVTVCVYAAAC